jgi:hypothetical protein
VTDHRINLTLYDLSNIIDGDIQKIIDELWVGCAGIRFGYASIWDFDKVLNL